MNEIDKNIFFSSKYCGDISKYFQTGIISIEQNCPKINIFSMHTGKKR